MRIHEVVKDAGDGKAGMYKVRRQQVANEALRNYLCRNCVRSHKEVN